MNPEPAKLRQECNVPPKLSPSRFIHLLVLTLPFLALMSGGRPASAAATPHWRQSAYRHILRHIKAPRFAHRTFNVLNYGAAGNHRTDCRRAFARAIAACHQAGGGTVLVPSGRYICNGSIDLLSNVNFHLAAGAVIQFGLNPADYLVRNGPHKGCVMVRYEGVWIYNYQPLISANSRHNIAITGHGIFGGGRNRPGSPWLNWYKTQLKKKWADRKIVRAMANNLPPMSRRVMGPGYHLMPEFCDLDFCRNVLISGVTFRHSPFWTIHPCFCRNVIIQNVHVHNDKLNMDDGIDVDSSQYVLIQNCHIRTDDDNIVLKAGKNADGWEINGGHPTEDIIIRHNWLSHNIGFGSEMSGGIQYIFALDNTFGKSANIIFMKWGGRRGGFIRHIHFRGIFAKTARSLADQAVFWAGKYALPAAAFVPEVRNWSISDVKIGCISQPRPTGSKPYRPQPAAAMLNMEPTPFANIRFNNISIGTMNRGLTGFWFQNTAGIHFKHVTIHNHAIVNLHPRIRDGGTSPELRWQPTKMADGYAIYVNNHCVAITHDPSLDFWRFGQLKPSSKLYYLGIGMIDARDRPLLIQNIKYAGYPHPHMHGLRQLIRQATVLFRQDWRPPSHTPEAYTALQKSLSNLYYWIHSAKLVADNSTASKAQAAEAVKALDDAMHNPALHPAGAR